MTTLIRRLLAARPALPGLVVIVVVAAGLAAVGLAAVTTARAGQRDLLSARSALTRAQEAITDGDLDAAAAAFAEAERFSGRAVAGLQSPPVRIVGFLPEIGGAERSATAVSVAATQISEAGADLFADLAALPGGTDALVPRDQRIPTELAGLAEGFERAHRRLTLAAAVLESAPASTPIGQVDQARAALAQELAAVTPRLAQLAALARGVPVFLGADGPRRYLVGAQNPAELRGTGGLIGAFAILSVVDGRLEVGDFTPTQELNQDLQPPVVSNPDYLARYGGALDRGFFARWANLNMTPDMPTAGEAILSSYREATGEQLDGVVLVDPFALQALMTVTGPRQVPPIGEVTAANVVEVVANQAPAYFDDQGERKETLGDVAAEVLAEFLSGGHEPADQARALAEATGGGHVLLYSADPRVQADLAAAGLAGGLGAAEPGYLGVFGHNLSETKLDFYMDRDVRFELFLNPDGSATGVIDVTLSNPAPTAGLPAYTIGPSPGLDLEAGENLTSVNVYCGPCQPESATRTSDFLEVFSERELGHTVLETWEPVPAGTTSGVRHGVRIPRLWTRRGSDGEAMVTFQDQATIKPTRLSVIIHPPAGWVVTPERPDMSVRDDGAAVWEGDAAPLQRFPLALSLATRPPQGA